MNKLDELLRQKGFILPPDYRRCLLFPDNAQPLMGTAKIVVAVSICTAAVFAGVYILFGFN